ncbi:acyltransferase [Hymenobacter sp. RP-2-7]|uniref:Acyltransferase n=1 Tax=Hymenobacter polaris TaxID=2682546 RepID=A0A7Y0AFD4_9BACT|nr:acyltransferase [Hymenobacter polaris]NML66355.1 acyltransferase [Hymenobacter polaris]
MLPLPNPPTALRYQPELMGFRAVAIGLVVLGHWLLPPFPLSEVGRLPLFVLSGYLISGIIWKNDIYWGGSPGWTRRLGIFYTRRFLRIIPPYYLSLALGALLPLATLYQYPGWFLLPLTNVLCYQLRSWPEGVGHYWTMALEEQFYLIWPLALGLLRQRAAGLWLLVAAGLAYRCYAVLYLVPATPVYATVLLPACLDLFALGALLRLHTAAARARPGQRRPYPGWPAAAAGAAWGLLWAGTRATLPAEQLWSVLAPGLGAVVSYFTLRWLMSSPRQGRWLAHPLAQWLGKRSYGMYLFHLMLPVFYQRLIYYFLPAASAWRPWLLQPLVMALALLPLLVSLSALSWHWLEAPLERLKTRYAYEPAAVPQQI